MPVRPTALCLRAPAKVNLYLEVLGRRSDGYHDLKMLMAPVSLFDELSLERLGEPGRIEVVSAGSDMVESGEKNLCHKAARYYFEAAGVRGGVRVAVEKRIPVGAGLGGGSSDAAATILGLEALFGAPLSDDAHRVAAFRVGADVPFFFARSAAWVTGIGEAVASAGGLPLLWLVVVHPGIFLPTAAVYGRLREGLTSPRRPRTIRSFDFSGIVEGLRNDLEPAALGLEPAVGGALELLAAAGARGTLMSGSGSASFGLFQTEQEAHRGAALVRGHPRAQGWRVEVVHTLPPGSFPFLADSPDWGVDKR